MNHGELLTRLSIWLALGVAALGIGLRLETPGRSAGPGWARLAWTIGCGLFLVHVVCAFHYFHQWSQAAAYAETARQTSAFTGLNWGGGLYFNYLFAILWLADVLWWWFASASYARRPFLWNAFWDGFFFFMVLNGTVVFVSGPRRWLGVALCAVLVILWVRHWRKKTIPVSN